jgi:hypothetical protein
MSQSLRVTFCNLAKSPDAARFRECLDRILSDAPLDQIELRLGFQGPAHGLEYLLGLLCPDQDLPQHQLLPGGIERLQWIGRGGVRIHTWRLPHDLSGEQMERLLFHDVPLEAVYAVLLAEDCLLPEGWWGALAPLLEKGIDLILVGPLVAVRAQRLKEADFPPRGEHNSAAWLEGNARRQGWSQAVCELPGSEHQPGTVAGHLESSPGLCAPIMAEIAPGELLDKITILQIKRSRVRDEHKLEHIRTELGALLAAQARSLKPSVELARLMTRLKTVNETLWDIEDAIRLHEQRQDFGPRFIELARAVYHNNDERARVKREINQLFHSQIAEEKSYAATS